MNASENVLSENEETKVVEEQEVCEAPETATGKKIKETKNEEKQKSVKNEKTPRTAKEKWKSVFQWSLPSLATLVVICLAMIVGGVWPFGHNIVGYIDYSAGLVPAYTHLWDVLHGQANIFADWNLGGGSNAYASWGYFLISPLDWIVAIFPRAMVAYSISLVIIIKLCLMAFTAFWLFKKLFKNVNTYVLAIFAVLWAFSGWTMVHFTNVGWLDIMILLPVFVWSVKNIQDTGKIWPLVLVLAWMLLLSYYISYMALLGLVVCAFVYTFTAIKKGERKKFVSNLFFAVITAILISAVIFIPSCLTSLGAHRFSSDGTSAFSISYFTNFFSKFAHLVFYSLPIFFFIKLFFKIKQDKQNILFFVISFGIILLGLVIEPINMMWHTGSYYCFPYRYSFVLIFLMTLGALYYINKFCKPNSFFKEEQKPIKLDKVLKYIFLIVLFVLFVVMAFLESKTGDHPYRTINVASFLGYFSLCALGLMLLFLGFRTKNKAWVAILCVIVVCTGQVLCYNFKFVGSQPESRNYDIENAQEIDLSGLSSTYRLKDKNELYIDNLALLTKQPQLATWIHISSENQWQTHHKLGYNTVSTVLKDSGGTTFSDMMLGVKYVMSDEELSPSLYTKIKEWNYKYTEENEETKQLDFLSKTVFLYETKFNLPYLYSFNSTDVLKDFEQDKNPFEVQNQIYKSLFGKTLNIVKNITALIEDTPDEDGFYTITLSNTALANLYFYGNFKEAKLGDKIIKSVDGIVDLGTTNHDVVLKVKASYNDVLGLRFARVDVSDIQNLALSVTQNAQSYEAKGNTLSITYDNTNGDKYLFVPTTNLQNFEVKVNGKTAKAEKALNGFVAVAISAGQNNIEITFVPANIKIGAIISLVAIALFVIFFLLNWKLKLSEKKWVVWIGVVGACLIVLLVVALVYARPLWRFVTNTF